uniref:Glycosyltransferase RgtA/B/C/D-like domain-containing protein n=1 Tax=candidate division WWE3 bacterium TaxID=2053526 RepID=A0A7C4TS27_UNCKA
MKQILLESYDTSERSGHIQIMFGQETRNPGPLFYLLLLATKTSLVGLVGVAIFFGDRLYTCFRLGFGWVQKKAYLVTKKISFVSYISIFYLGYFIVICIFDKKVDRYVISLYPFLAIIAVLGWHLVLKRFFSFKSAIFAVIAAIFLLATYSIATPLVKIFPHHLTYVNPIFGDAADSNRMIGQKLFGIGIFDLRDKIVENFGDRASVGINDIGPLTSIYPKGKVYNVLSEHPNSYKVLVLGPNKELPKNLREDPNIKFKKVDSIYINGLEFWRIYKRI